MGPAKVSFCVPIGEVVGTEVTQSSGYRVKQDIFGATQGISTPIA